MMRVLYTAPEIYTRRAGESWVIFRGGYRTLIIHVCIFVVVYQTDARYGGSRLTNLAKRH